jgi:hypothetical protein
MFRPHSLNALLIGALASTLFAAHSNPPETDPANWTSDDVYRILNNSPWTKSVKMRFSSAAPIESPGSNSAPANTNVGNQMPMSGMGRRGMGGGMGGRSRTYSSSGGSSNANSNVPTGPTQVTIQWQSAVPVQIAAARKAGDQAATSSFKPLEDYVIGVIGIPAVALGGRAASTDSESTTDQERQQRIADRVKTAASLVRSGHDPLTPTKVEMDQGFDGRILIHFPKSDPITLADKTVEFRLVLGKNELRKKFELKEMEYQGKPAL